MRSTLIVKREVFADAGSCIADAVVGVQIDLFVLDRLPQPLDENVVAPAAFAVHADRDAVCLEHLGELDARELAALVGVEERGGLAFLDTKSGGDKWMNCSIVTAIMPIERSRLYETLTQEPLAEV